MRSLAAIIEAVVIAVASVAAIAVGIWMGLAPMIDLQEGASESMLIFALGDMVLG